MEKLKDVIKSQGFTAKEVAEKLGVQDRTISNWNNKVSYPNVHQFNQLADILGIGFPELHNRVYLNVS